MYLDSQAGVFIADKGYSRKSDINDLMKQIWWENHKKKTYLQVEWIPREENKSADILSRIALSIPDKTKEEITTKLTDESVKWLTPADTSDLLIIRPDTNWIGTAMLLMERKRQNSGIITPQWKAQPWWPRVLTQSDKTLILSDGNILSIFKFNR